MHHLLAASLVLLVFGFGTAASLATAKALQDWAMSNFDVNATVIGGDVAQRPPQPSTYVHR
jgi:hypothetical protein